VIIALLGCLEQVAKRIDGHTGIMADLGEWARVGWTRAAGRDTQCA
jgi:hypothetical protein